MATNDSIKKSYNNQPQGRKDMLADYVQVNDRIMKFYEKFPSGRIITEIVSWNDSTIVMKATVFRTMEDAYPSAVGHAYEVEGASFINKTSALENCETSAVGRALAILGFEIKKSVASYEEVANAKLNQEPITGEQIGIIRTLALSLAEKVNQPEAEIYKKLKVAELTSLTTVQAIKATETLNKWIKQAEEKAS